MKNGGVDLNGRRSRTTVSRHVGYDLPAVRHRLRALFTVVSDPSKGVSRLASAYRSPARVFAISFVSHAPQIWPEMDSNARHNTPPQVGADTGGETSNRNEIPTVTVAMPFMQVDMLGHSGASTADAQATTANRMAEGDEIPPPKPDFSAPPPYEVATKLPSYEEVQREKTLQGEPQPQVHMSGNIRPPQQPLTILAIDTEAAEGDPESGLLGTDFMFFTAFLVAFLFNWIGFLLLMCFCHTIASRYGALAGFGLSLTKWTLIVKHSTDLASRENSWLWWLIMAFGVLICVRAIIQYLNIKRGWRLLSGSAQERLLFFY